VGDVQPELGKIKKDAEDADTRAANQAMDAAKAQAAAKP
jgi:hypothetical protein